MIEFVFAASPETIRREPQDFHAHRSVGHLQDLAACALCSLVFLAVGGLGHGGIEVFCCYKWSLPTING